MFSEVDVNTLDLWKNVEKLSVDEFMCLLFGLEPGTVKFDYGDPKEWPENAGLLYRILADDIQAKRLRVTFDDINGDPFYNGAYDRFYAMNDNPWWADGGSLHCGGKLHRYELVKWLSQKGIPSPFFNVVVIPSEGTKQQNHPEPTKQAVAQNAVSAGEPIKADEANDTNTALHQPDAPAKVKRKYKPRGAISAVAAADILGVTSRQVQNWDAGKNMPDGYPGRRNEAAFQLFANEWQHKKRMNEVARAMNRAVRGEAVNLGTKSVFDDDGD